MTARQDDLENSVVRGPEMVADEDDDGVCCFGMVRSMNDLYVRPQTGHLSLQLAAHHLNLQGRGRSRHSCFNPNFV